MKSQLPDYYSILEVRPDASQEVIKASYRRMMITLKMHPDLGGTHEIAAQINEAYAVLGDKVKRSTYARMYVQERLEANRTAARAKKPPSKNDATPRSSATAASARTSVGSMSDQCCPLCHEALPHSIGPDTRCAHCRSPLSPPPQPSAYGREIFGRRSSARSAKNHLGQVRLPGQAQGITVKMRDVSLSGIGFYSEKALTVEQVFSFRDPGLEALAIVVSCRKRGRLYSVHAKLLTVAFQNKAGIFVSSSG